MTDLATAGLASAGKAINTAGQVAGEAVRPDGQRHAVLYSGGAATDLGTIGDSNSAAEAIDELGDVTGMYDDSTGSHAFLYSGGAMIDLLPGRVSFVSGLQAINAVHQVVGSFEADGSTRGFMYADGQAADIGTLGAEYTVATAINDAGKVTGISARVDGERHAFIYSAGTMSDLGTLGGTFSVGYALNEADRVAGESMTSSGALHAFVSVDGTLVDLGQQIEALAPAGAVVESVAYGINGVGQVIGRYTVSDSADTEMPVKTRGFIATPVASLFESLIDSVAGIGPGKSLQNKLEKALAQYLAHDQKGTCSSLNGFVHEVNAQDGKKIEPSMAAQLIRQAGSISSVIGCP
jgi:probable HAF family extracellular repeat protein